MNADKRIPSQFPLTHFGELDGAVADLSLILKRLGWLVLVSCGAIFLPVAPARAGNCSVVRSDGLSLDYTLNWLTGGTGGNIQNQGTLEERASSLEKPYSITFHCDNTSTVNLEIIATTITAPDFPSSSADNLDLIGSDSTGVTHLVDVTASNMTPIIDQEANRNGTTIVNPNTEGQNLNLDAEGNITVNLTSTYTLTGGAEELGAGDYGSQFVITVTPNGGGNLVSYTTDLNGSVAKECSVDARSQFSQGGGLTPLPYQVTTGTVGGEERVTRLEGSDRVVFDCNSSGFNYSITLDSLKAPNLSSPENLDLVTNSEETGINHEVVIDLKFPAGNIPNTQTTYSKVNIGNIVSSDYTDIDLNGDLEIDLTSRFQTINNAEELGSGDYGARFTITVIAQ